jgi:hypothetical protein
MVNRKSRRDLLFRLAAVSTALGIGAVTGCNRETTNVAAVSATSTSTQAPARNIVALGRIEPTSGLIAISAIPGERLERYAPGVEPGAQVAAGAELARTGTFDLRQTQLKAAELKASAAQEQRSQELLAAQVQVEQALATQAQAEAKLREVLAQEGKLRNLAEAADIAADDYQVLEKLQATDPELVTASQLRKRRNASERAAREYEAAAAAYPDALQAARKGVAAAEAGAELARQSAALAEKVDQSLAADLDRQAAEAALDQSVLRAPAIEGGPTTFTVLRTMVEPGELIAQSPVLEIADLQRSPAFTGKYANGHVGGDGGIPGRVVRIGSMVASPGLTNRNPLAPSDRSIVEVDIEIAPTDKQATAEAANKVGLQVTVEFLRAAGASQKASGSKESE